MKKGHSAFTLIELMIVVAIVAFLSMISLPSFMKFLAKAKRAEAFMNLGSIYVAQKSYWADHGSFSDVLSGPGGIGWSPEGYSGGGKKERFYYTYGVHGSEGKNYFTGKLGASVQEFGTTRVSSDSFLIAAAGDIDGDGESDVLTINELHDIVVQKDDLA